MVFEATRRFFRRHRSNLLIGAGLAATSYLTINYITNKLSDAKQRLYQERVARENINRRFHQNQEDCTFTVLALLPTLTTHLHTLYPTETHTQTLQQKKAHRLSKRASISSNTPLDNDASADLDNISVYSSTTTASTSKTPSKAELWDLIKHTALTRTFTSLYTLPLLTLLTRIQLNLLGRRNYLSSVLALAGDDAAEISLRTAGETRDRTNQVYLTFSWWLLHRGYARVGERVGAAVREAFAGVNPRDTIGLGEFRERAAEVRRRVEEGWQLLPVLLPTDEEGEREVLAEIAGGMEGVEAAVRRLLDETSDLIESPGAWRVWESMVGAGWELLEERIAGGVFGGGREREQGERVMEMVGDEERGKVASLLAAVAREAREIGRGEANEYLKAIEGINELEAFAALVYSSNFEFAAQMEEAVKA